MEIKIGNFFKLLKAIVFTVVFLLILLGWLVATTIIFMHVLGQGSLIQASQVLFGSIFVFGIISSFMSAY